MSKTSKVRATNDGRVMFWCPGCDGAHGINVGTGPGPRWGYNDNPDAPTFTPSIKVTGGMIDGKWSDTACCHSFVNEGRIQFLGDCTHALAGQTVDLPPWDDTP
ncbi:hypothetical protein D3C71_221710 [compost metagenome]